MEPLPRPDGGNQNRGPKLLAVFWTQLSTCMIVVAMRMYSRYKLKTTGVDDWFMVVTLALFIAAIIAATFNALNGGGRHLYYLSPGEIEYATKTNWIEHPFGIMAPVTAKISVALLILRLIGPVTFWRRWFLYLIIFLSTIIGTLTVIFEFASCNPPRALWVPLSQIPGARCWNAESLNDFNIFAGAYNAFIDFCLALLPLTIVWKLNLNNRRKFALSILLSLGILAGICSVVKASYIPELTATSDFLWDTYDLDVWTVTEICLLVICASIPTMKPIYDLGREHAHFNLYYFSSKYNRTKTPKGSRGFDGANINHPYQYHADDISYSQGYDSRAQGANRGLGLSAQVQSADSDSWVNGDGNASIGMGDIVVQRGWEVHHGAGAAKLRGNDAV